MNLFSGNESLFSVFRRLATMTRKNSSIQSLYELCKETFASTGTPPASPQAILKLSSLMDSIHPADVGLKNENLEDDRGHGYFGKNHIQSETRWTQPITFLDIYECESFTICIFCLPTSSSIPLHDHPGMTVLSKVLYGSMHAKAYDWVEPSSAAGSPGKLAKLVVDRVITAPCGTSVLYPKSGGNLHSFTAITPCAVLDILAPPYREHAGRRCAYYHDYPYSSFPTSNGIVDVEGKEEGYAWLAEINTPENLYMRPGRYAGPSIQV